MKKIAKVTFTGIGIAIYLYLQIKFNLWVYGLGFTGSAKTLVLFMLGFMFGYSLILIFSLVGLWLYNEYDRYKTRKYLKEMEERRGKLNKQTGV